MPEAAVIDSRKRRRRAAFRLQDRRGGGFLEVRKPDKQWWATAV